jgi:hypothetical protein
MKAPTAQAGGEAFNFFLGPRNRKMHFKKLGFRRGSDLSMLSKAIWAPGVLIEEVQITWIESPLM